MSNNTNYSVLTSVYHKENPEYLRLSIESIQNQTIPTDDYVIVKDGPLTEELEAVIKEYQDKYNNIHIVSLPVNVGLGAALNAGLKECKYEMVARMDTDDISLETRCEMQLATFNINKDLDIVGTSIFEFSDDEKKVECIKHMPTTNLEIKKYARHRNPFNHPTIMYKKSAVLKYGGYQEGIRGEDFALFTEMVFRGANCINLAEPLLKYRANKNQFVRRSSLDDTKAVLDVINRNFKRKYINFWDWIYVHILQITCLIIPRRIGSVIFKKLFRMEATDSLYQQN